MWWRWSFCPNERETGQGLGKDVQLHCSSVESHVLNSQSCWDLRARSRNMVQLMPSPSPTEDACKGAPVVWAWEKDMVAWVLAQEWGKDSRDPLLSVSPNQGRWMWSTAHTAQWGSRDGKVRLERAGQGRGTQPDHACVHSLISQIHQVLKSHGQDYLVGNKLSRADIFLVELLYCVDEFDPSLLANFSLLKVILFTVLRDGRSRLPPWSLILGLLDWWCDAPHQCPGLRCPEVSKICS